jgi:Protein of unknown function (DUF1566)
MRFTIRRFKILGWCVSAALVLIGLNIPEQNSRFLILNNQEEVEDRLTGLVWLRCPAAQASSFPKLKGVCHLQPQSMAWDEAKNYAEEISISRGQAWRLPNVHELTSIVDFQRCNPALDRRASPDFYTSKGNPKFCEPSYYFLTSNVYDNDPYDKAAWVVASGTGESLVPGHDRRGALVRLVRDK